MDIVIENKNGILYINNTPLNVSQTQPPVNGSQAQPGILKLKKNIDINIEINDDEHAIIYNAVVLSESSSILLADQAVIYIIDI